MDNRTLVDILMKIIIKYGKIPVCTFDCPVRHVLTGDGKSISPELFFQTGKWNCVDVFSVEYGRLKRWGGIQDFLSADRLDVGLLAFLIDDSVPVLPEKMEKDHPEELMAFKQEVKTGRLVEWWKNADDLAQKISISLHKQMDRKKRPGWVRADSFDIEQSHAELAIYLHKDITLAMYNRKITGIVMKYEEEPSLFQRYAYWLTASGRELFYTIRQSDDFEVDEEYALLCLKDIKEKNPEFYVAAFKNGEEAENLLED